MAAAKRSASGEVDEFKQAAPKKARHTYGTKEGFLGVFDSLVEEFCSQLAPKYEMMDDAVAYIRRMMKETVPGGKLNRGLTVVHGLELIVGRELSAKEARKASVLGWCIEWLQACFLVADDIMDASQTRRGKPCWYKHDDVRMNAINDSFILRSAVGWFLSRTFATEPYYVQLVEMFREVTLQTELGQMLDLTSAPADGTPDLTRFTIERYRKIVKYKTAFYSFYLPVACAIVLAGNGTEAALSEARDILVPMGVYFQVQDDVLDCFAPPEVIGKVGTDIQDNKCGWLIVQALEVATAEQKAMLKANYGKWDDACVAKVKALYRELNLQEKFNKYEADSHASLTAKIAMAKHTPAAAFNSLLKKIYKRSK